MRRRAKAEKADRGQAEQARQRGAEGRSLGGAEGRPSGPGAERGTEAKMPKRGKRQMLGG